MRCSEQHGSAAGVGSARRQWFWSCAALGAAPYPLWRREQHAAQLLRRRASPRRAQLEASSVAVWWLLWAHLWRWRRLPPTADRRPTCRRAGGGRKVRRTPLTLSLAPHHPLRDCGMSAHAQGSHGTGRCAPEWPLLCTILTTLRASCTGQLNTVPGRAAERRHLDSENYFRCVHSSNH